MSERIEANEAAAAEVAEAPLLLRLNKRNRGLFARGPAAFGTVFGCACGGAQGGRLFSQSTVDVAEELPTLDGGVWNSEVFGVSNEVSDRSSTGRKFGIDIGFGSSSKEAVRFDFVRGMSQHVPELCYKASATQLFERYR